MASVRTELKEKNAGYALGSLWLILQPLFLLLIYSVVYLFIFRLRPDSLSALDYLLLIFSGLVPFIGMSEAITSGSASIRNNRSILKNTVFPAELIPVRSVLSAQMNFLFPLLMVLAYCGFQGHLTVRVLFIPYIIVLQVMFLTGLCWILSLLSLILRDVQHMIAYMVMVLMISSPIAYSLDMLPDNLKFFFWLNPVAQFIVSYQSIIVYERLPSVLLVCSMSGISIIFFLIGFLIFKKLKPVIINHV